MAIKNDKTPGSITQTNDAMDERIANISNVNKTVDGMQKDVYQEIEETEQMIDDSEDIEKVQSSMIGVLKKLSQTIGSFSTGIKKVTISSASATKDAISQYGKAVSEDISFNKKNVIAMAMARSTPLFGYFAAKFMETDVFRTAAAKLREGFGNVLGSVTTKFKEGFGNIIDKVKSRKSKKADISSISEKSLTDTPIPKMQHGGYVSKGGVAQLHPAEVVMPIEKVLANVDDRLGTFESMINIYRKEQLKSMTNMRTFVSVHGEKQKVGLVKGFIRAWGEVNTQYLEPDSKRQLRALLAIQDALEAQIGTWRQVWQKMLIEHPMFRQIIFLAKTINKTIGMPFKAIYRIFKARGGYVSHLSRNKNPMIATATNIGLVYSEGMWRLDNLVLYTKATAEATRDLSAFVTGKSYGKLEGVSTGIWRLSNLITKPFMWAWHKGTKGIENVIREVLIGKGHESLAELLTKERDIPSLKGKNARKLEGIYGGLSATAEEQKGKKELTFYDTMINCCKVERKEKQVDNKRDKKMLAYNKDQTESLVKVKRRLRSKNFLSILMTVGGFLMSTLKSMFGGLMGGLNGISRLAPFLSKIGTGAGLAKFLGPASAVLAAGALGYGLGTIINKYLIAPAREKWFKHVDDITREGRKSMDEIRKTQLEKARTGKTGAERREGQVGLRTTKDIYGTFKKKRDQDVGGWSINRERIQKAQVEYANKNLNEYMKYDPDHLTQLRGEWLNQGGFREIALIGMNPEKYGARREAAFLEYVKKHGKFTAIESTLYDKGMMAKDKVQEVGSKVVEGTTLAINQAKDKIVEMTAYTKNLEKGLTKVGSMIQEGTQESVVAVNNISNSVANSIQNQSSSSVQGGRKALSQAKDYYNSKIVTGMIN